MKTETHAQTTHTSCFSRTIQTQSLSCQYTSVSITHSRPRALVRSLDHINPHTRLYAHLSTATPTHSYRMSVRLRRLAPVVSDKSKVPSRASRCCRSTSEWLIEQNRIERLYTSNCCLWSWVIFSWGGRESAKRVEQDGSNHKGVEWCAYESHENLNTRKYSNQP